MINRIEHELSSLSFKKKIMITVIVTLMFISVINMPVKSASLGEFITDQLSNITDEIFTSINQTLAKGVEKVTNAILDIFLNPFEPSFGTFDSHTETSLGNAREFIMKWGAGIGYFFATLIFFFSMFCYFFSGKVTDTKDTPISLVAKFSIVVFIEIKLSEVISTISSYAMMLYSEFNELGVSNETASNFFENVITGATKNTISILGIKITGILIPGLALVLLVVAIILIIKLVMAYLKMYMELATRYIVTMVLVCLFGAFAGTIVSNNTSKIFKSYLETMFSSFLLLLFDLFWFKMCMLLGVSGGMDVFQYIFLLQLLKLGTKFDGMLKSMGLGVATGAGRVASSCRSGLRDMGRALQTGKELARKGGSMVAGKMADNPNQIVEPKNAQQEKQAKDYRETINKADAMGGNKEGFGDYNGAVQGAAKAGAQGTKYKGYCSASEAADIINRATNPNEPATKTLNNAVNGLTDGKLKEGMQEIFGSDYKISGANAISYKGTDGKNHTGIKVSGMDKNGNAFSGVYGAKETLGMGIQLDNFGSASAFSMSNSMKKGETAQFNSSDDIWFSAGDKAKEGIDTMVGSQDIFDNGGTIESVGKNGEREDCFRIYDSKGTLRGSVVGDNYVQSSSSLSGKEMLKMTDSWKADLESKGFETTGDFRQSQSDPSKWTVGIKQAGNPEELPAIATFTSIGENPTAKYDNSNPNNAIHSFKSDSGNEVKAYSYISELSNKENSSNDRGPRSSDVVFSNGNDNRKKGITEDTFNNGGISSGNNKITSFADMNKNNSLRGFDEHMIEQEKKSFEKASGVTNETKMKSAGYNQEYEGISNGYAKNNYESKTNSDFATFTPVEKGKEPYTAGSLKELEMEEGSSQLARALGELKTQIKNNPNNKGITLENKWKKNSNKEGSYLIYGHGNDGRTYRFDCTSVGDKGNGSKYESMSDSRSVHTVSGVSKNDLVFNVDKKTKKSGGGEKII